MLLLVLGPRLGTTTLGDEMEPRRCAKFYPFIFYSSISHVNLALLHNYHLKDTEAVSIAILAQFHTFMLYVTSMTHQL